MSHRWRDKGKDESQMERQGERMSHRWIMEILYSTRRSVDPHGSFVARETGIQYRDEYKSGKKYIYI